MTATPIAKLTIEHYDQLIRVWGDAGLPYKPSGRDSRDSIAREMKRADTAYFGIFEDNRLVAVGVATSDGRKGWINRVAVDPEHRLCGYGRRIVEECEKCLRRLGLTVISCLIEEHNLPSMELFSRLGFVCHDDVHYFSKRESSDS